MTHGDGNDSTLIHSFPANGKLGSTAVSRHDGRHVGRTTATALALITIPSHSGAVSAGRAGGCGIIVEWIGRKLRPGPTS
jgi:hypothetical protein